MYFHFAEYCIAEIFRGRIFHDFAENQAFRGFNFAMCMDSSCLCTEISRFFGEGWLPIDIRLPLSSLWSSSSFPKEQWATWPHFVLTALQSDSSYFHLLTALSLRSTPHCWSACYRSLIPSLHRIPSNLSRLFGGELHVRAARRPILGIGIGCKVTGYLLVGPVNRLWSHCS